MKIIKIEDVRGELWYINPETIMRFYSQEHTLSYYASPITCTYIKFSDDKAIRTKLTPEELLLLIRG